MASKRKWLGLAALGAFLIAIFRRKKHHEAGGAGGEQVEGSIET